MLIMNGYAVQKLLLMFLLVLFCSCKGPAKSTDAVPLLYLFDSSKVYEYERILVAGYPGYVMEDIAVLYVTLGDYKNSDPIYRANLFFASDDYNNEFSQDIGSMCVFLATVEYRNSVPILLNPVKQRCRKTVAE